MYQHRRYIKTLVMVTVLSCMARIASGEELLMALRLNGQTVSDGEIVTLHDNKVDLPIVLVQQLRLHIPSDILATSPTSVTLDQLPGVRTKIDTQTLTVDIDTAGPESFETTVIQNYVPTRPADKADKPGLFMNYNVLEQTIGNMNLSSGLFSVGSFSEYGTAISDTVANSTEGVTRLRSCLIKDSPDGKGSITIGDSFLTSGAIGQSFPFGGIQISSRSASSIDPQQIPFESILGQAAVPSTVDVYVNNALQSHQAVPTGPFVLDNIPVATGDGSIRVVVRDALGEERVLVRSFYTSPLLLPEGHSQYSYESGMLRRNYGSSSFEYAEPFMSGTHRYGWSNWMTTEFHGEASLQRQVVGEQTSFLISPLGTLNVGGAVSNKGSTPGFLWLAGMETDTHPLTAGISTEMASAHFTQLGYSDDRTLKQSSQARVSYDMEKYGSLSASIIRLDLDGQAMSNTVAASYNTTIPYIGYFGASLFSTLGQHSTGIVFSLSVPLGDTTTISSQVTHDQSGWGKSAQVTQTVPDAGGVGFHGLVDESDTTRHSEAGVIYRAANAQVTADGGMLNGTPIGRVGASGSVGWFDGELFAAHETEGNFAVVDTDGIGGIHVFADQQLAGVTDDEGKLVVPRLRPHETNNLSIDPADVPFDVTAPETEKTVVPLNQTGYVVNFGLQRTHGATASLVLDHGGFVPAGSSVVNARTGASFTVGNDGIVYFTDLTGADNFNVQLINGACKINVVVPSLQEVQPDLGKITCHA